MSRSANPTSGRILQAPDAGSAPVQKTAVMGPSDLPPGHPAVPVPIARSFFLPQNPNQTGSFLGNTIPSSTEALPNQQVCIPPAPPRYQPGILARLSLRPTRPGIEGQGKRGSLSPTQILGIAAAVTGIILGVLYSIDRIGRIIRSAEAGEQSIGDNPNPQKQPVAAALSPAAVITTSTAQPAASPQPRQRRPRQAQPVPAAPAPTTPYRPIPTAAQAPPIGATPTPAPSPASTRGPFSRPPFPPASPTQPRSEGTAPQSQPRPVPSIPSPSQPASRPEPSKPVPAGTAMPPKRRIPPPKILPRAAPTVTSTSKVPKPSQTKRGAPYPSKSKTR